MKFSVAAAALLAGVAAAGQHGHARRHNREAFRHLEPRDTDTCACTTVYSTIYGEASLCPPPPPLPTPHIITEPGTYTLAATTVTVTDLTTVCAATATVLPEGTHTIGGVTTVVVTSTTVICPVAAVHTKSGVITTTVIDTTYICPSAGTYTIGASTVTAPTSTIVVYPVPTSYTPGTYTKTATVVTVTKSLDIFICPYVATPITVTVQPVAPTSPAKAETSAAAPAPAIGGGDLWAMTYSPYNNDQSCKSAGQVDSDLQQIASRGFKTVRIYSTDCNGLQNVGASCRKYGLKVILGIFITSGDTSSCEPQVKAIISWAQWDLVELIVVGNEAVHNGYLSAGGLASYISSVKPRIAGAGYTGPFTCAETVDILQSVGKQLCGVIDVVGCHIHPYFDAGTPASNAGTFFQSQLAIVEGVCPGKDVYILETGWPSQGKSNGKAVPGVSEQQTAIAQIKAIAGGKSAWLSWVNDMWKQPGPFGVEQYFGCGTLF